VNKTEVLSALEESRENILDAIDGLSAEEMQEPGMDGDWSVKDLLAHLARWEAELVKLLWQAQQGQKPSSIHFSPVPVDEINARWQKEYRSRPLERVLEDFHGVRNQTVRRVEDLPEEAFEAPHYYSWLDQAPLWKWISDDSFEHEAEHAAQIRAWRQMAAGR
jgi:hypothetical protein